jgi:hypothetical protein
MDICCCLQGCKPFYNFLRKAHKKRKYVHFSRQFVCGIFVFPKVSRKCFVFVNVFPNLFRFCKDTYIVSEKVFEQIFRFWTFCAAVITLDPHTVKNPSWKFRNIFMKARTISSIFLNFSILSYWFLNIHLYRAFGSKLPHTFFTVHRKGSLAHLQQIIR